MLTNKDINKNKIKKEKLVSKNDFNNKKTMKLQENIKVV